MSPNNFRKYVHQIIDLLEQQLKYSQVQGYGKTYKDQAVVRIVTAAMAVERAQP